MASVHVKENHSTKRPVSTHSELSQVLQDLRGIYNLYSPTYQHWQLSTSIIHKTVNTRTLSTVEPKKIIERQRINSLRYCVKNIRRCKRITKSVCKEKETTKTQNNNPTKQIVGSNWYAHPHPVAEFIQVLTLVTLATLMLPYYGCLLSVGERKK